MFSSRLRSSENPYECLLIYDVSDSSRGSQLEFCHPSNYPVGAFSKRLTEFLLPCNHKHTVSEQYALVFTGSDGKLEFVVCLSLPMSGYIVCVRSFLPWFEFLHEFLTWINRNGLYTPSSHEQLRERLQQLTIVGDFVHLPSTSAAASSALNLPIPDPRCHPFYYRYILEYYTSLSISNWIIVFESLLCEKSIIFYSSRIQRVTSCVLASLSLIYPLVWVHFICPLLPAACIEYAGCPSPFVVGMHSCMLEKVKDVVVPGARFVDLDNDQVYATGPSHHRLPASIRQWLVHRCNTSHKAILRNRQIVRSVAATAAAYLVEPFLEAMAVLLGGYRDALQRISPTPRSTSIQSSEIHPSTLSKSSPQTAGPHWTFDRDLFVASRGKNCKSYLQQLLHSQMVVQFIESRSELVNSALGIIPSDDFEDCVQYICGSTGTQLADALGRGRPELYRITKKLSRLGRKHSDHADRLPRLWAFHVPLSSSTTTGTQLSSASNDSSSSSSSSDAELYGSSETVSLREDCVEFHGAVPDTSTTTTHKRWRSFGSVSDSVQRESERTRRSLLSSVLCAIPDLPPDWLEPPPSTLPSSVGAHALPAPLLHFPDVIPSAFATSHCGGTQINENSQGHNLHANYLGEISELGDPFHPKQATHPISPADDLASFLRQLDPMSGNVDSDDLLK